MKKVIFSVLIVLLLLFSCTTPLKMSLSISLKGAIESAPKISAQSFEKDVKIEKYTLKIFQGSKLVLKRDLKDSLFTNLEGLTPGKYKIRIEGYNKTLVAYGEKETTLSYGENKITIQTIFTNGTLVITLKAKGTEIKESTIKGTLTASPVHNFIENNISFEKEVYPGVWEISINATTTQEKNVKINTIAQVFPASKTTLNFEIKEENIVLEPILPYLEEIKDATAEITNNGIKLSWKYTIPATFYIYKGSNELDIDFLGKTTNTEFVDTNPTKEKYIYYINAIYDGKESGLTKIDAKELLNEIFSSNIMYLLFVRSFFDGNNDGIGDLQGITRKIDYLKKLGISTIWLMPIFKSTSYHGYDVVDYYKINPEYGNINDFIELLKKAHENNIKIILDIPLNHSSDKNPWFLDAIENTTNSKYWNYYIMSLEEKNLPHWHYKVNSKGKKIYYFGIFGPSMPDFNLDNPEVKELHRDILNYWILQGVDGFRFDAVKHFYGNDWDDGIEKSTEYSKELARYVKSIKEDIIVVGEAYDGNIDILKKFAPMPVFDFNFMFNTRENYEGKDNLISTWYKDVDYEGIFPNYFPFLDNHDLNRFISVLCDEKYHNNSYGTSQYAVLNTLLVFLEGLPTIYYGNEIGLKGFKWNGPVYDEPVREPMQWYASQSGEGQTNWTKKIYQLKNITFGNANLDGAIYDDPYDGVSVEEEENEKSLLNYFKTIFNLKKDYYALSHGNVNIEKNWKNLIVLKKSYFNQEALVLINPDPIYQNKFTIPKGYTRILYADLNNFTWDTQKTYIDADVEYTINPRQVYIFILNH
ncbi:hypothetical protein XJ44_04730 [Thermosipho affectus]|uniref:Glycosyl hydrolase family 13 catalytic domain-containing protein n=1 Tax=Thermosipho affectus TaxID=660294 RepID=A0ABX3IIS2_9BACT|nr:alpha-amylase family glycosyl hydrolase [Thermosipho affectus]ONN27101.1 hypothetical protein XJ44_04730 [Thermosipho affectus]